MMFKKNNTIVAFVSLFLVSLSLLSCSAIKSKKEIIVFAASSMTEALNNIKNIYEEEHKNYKIIYNFDSSGTLQKQIENGAKCDIFLSASKKQMDTLKDKDILANNTIVDLLENKVALIVNTNNTAKITSISDLMIKLGDKQKDIIVAMGNESVPVGQYTSKIFAYYNLNEEELAKSGFITYGNNVKNVLSLVINSAVSCGFIYMTDAKSADINPIDFASKEMCGQVIYPMAILKDSYHKKSVNEFYSFIMSKPSLSIFKSIGFSENPLYD